MRHVSVLAATVVFAAAAAACGGEPAEEATGGEAGARAPETADADCTALTGVSPDSMREAEGGLRVLTLEEGDGPEARRGDTVRVHYLGCLTDGTKFDASYDRDEPFSFQIGAGRVIRGWDVGVAGMKPGGVRLLRIPPELGYGERGTPGGPIPPDATLLFRVERLAPRAAADTVGNGSG